jgi:hypothetical protein
MSIATKCICGHSISGICLDRIEQCMLIIRTNNLSNGNAGATPAPIDEQALQQEAEELYPYIYEVISANVWRDINKDKRNAYLTAARKYTADKKQVAESFLKFIGKNNWFVENDGTLWELAFTGDPKTSTVPFDEAWAAYLASLNQQTEKG